MSLNANVIQSGAPLNPPTPLGIYGKEMSVVLACSPPGTSSSFQGPFFSTVLQNLRIPQYPTLPFFFYNSFQAHFHFLLISSSYVYMFEASAKHNCLQIKVSSLEKALSSEKQSYDSRFLCYQIA